MAPWKCPACGRVREIVCPVCGKDKKAGETCSRCGSEFSHTKCPECGHVEEYSDDMYPEDYEEKLRLVVAGRRPAYLTYFELVRLAAELNHPRLREVCLNEPSHVRAVTEKAFRAGGEREAEILEELAGVEGEFGARVAAIARGA